MTAAFDPLAELSILSRFDHAEVFDQPYPYIVIRDALPTALYAALEASFPQAEVITDGREIKDTWYDYPACRVVADARIGATWQDFFRYHVSAAFYRELVTKLGAPMRDLHPQLEATLGRRLDELVVGMRPGGRGDPMAPGADVSMECQFYLNYTRAPRAVRGPHVDRPSELFAALLYFRDDADDSNGGDLQINALQAGAERAGRSRVRIDELPMEIAGARVRTVNTVPYAPNTLVLFLNSARSVHAVTPRSPTPFVRRHINFCADLNLPLFGVDRPARMALKESLGKAPVLWRLAKHL